MWHLFMLSRELAGMAARLSSIDRSGSARIDALGFRFQFFDACLCPAFERRRIARDGCLACALDLRHPSIKGRDQFEQFTNGLGMRYRHWRRPGHAASKRDVFQTSPQIVHRQ